MDSIFDNGHTFNQKIGSTHYSRPLILRWTDESHFVEKPFYVTCTDVLTYLKYTWTICLGSIWGFKSKWRNVGPKQLSRRGTGLLRKKSEDRIYPYRIQEIQSIKESSTLLTWCTTQPAGNPHKNKFTLLFALPSSLDTEFQTESMSCYCTQPFINKNQLYG